VPRIAVLRTSNSAAAAQSAGWLAYLFEQVWHLPYTRVTAGQIASGAMKDYDVLIATQGDPGVANNNPGGDESRLALRLGATLDRSRMAVGALVVR
jgi:hypothetical protein